MTSTRRIGRHERPEPSERPERPERRISLPFDVFAVSTRLGAYLDRALAPTGIRPAEYAVYSLMLETGPRTPTELANALGAPPTTISTYLTAMLERGDAQRIPNPDDGRSVRVVLTDRGRGVIRRVNPAFARAEAAILAELDDVDDVRATLARLDDAIARASTSLDAPSRHDVARPGAPRTPLGIEVGLDR